MSIHPVYIEPNRYNLVLIRKSVNKKLSKPYSSCEITIDKTYSQKNCIEKCAEKKIAVKYNCSKFGYYKSVDTSCNWEQSLSYFNEFKGFCVDDCPKECESTRYDYIISSLRSNLTEIDIRLSDFSYNEFVEVPKVNIFTLISSIGGALGLFIGLKFLSFIEFFEFIIEITFILFKN